VLLLVLRRVVVLDAPSAHLAVVSDRGVVLLGE